MTHPSSNLRGRCAEARHALRDALYDFANAARVAGVQIAQVDTSGALQRVRAEGDTGMQRSGWYVFHDGELPWGVFGNWKTGEKHHWRTGLEQDLNAAERARLDEAIRCHQAEQRQLRAAQYMHARGEALRLFTTAQPADAEHPYLRAKAVGAHGIRQANGQLLVPLCDAQARLWSVQRIDAAGNKRFLAGGRKHGLFHLIGPAPGAVLCIAEGYATAASIHEATGYPVAVAFDAGNLEPVAVALRQHFPGVHLVICADDDAGTAARIGRNPGLDAAHRAAMAVGGRVALPPRSEGSESQVSAVEGC